MSVMITNSIMLFEQQAINFYWPNIDAALDRHPEMWENLTKEYIYNKLMKNEFQIWGLCSPDSVHILVMTSIEVFPNGKRIVRIHWVVGNSLWRYAKFLDDWMDSAIRILKCEEIWGELGRRGWGRFAKRFGFEEVSVIVRRKAKLETRQ